MVAGAIFVAIVCLGDKCVGDSSVAAANDEVKVDAKLNKRGEKWKWSSPY